MIKKLMQSIRDYKRPAIETPVFVGIEVLFAVVFVCLILAVSRYRKEG